MRYEATPGQPYCRQALHIAAERGDLPVLMVILQNCQVDLDVQTFSGCTALHLAAGHGHHKAVRALAEAGAEVDKPAKHELTPLLAAAQYGYDKAMSALLDAGADANRTANGVSPLHLACAAGHADAVRCLCEHGAKLVASEPGMYAPLEVAAMHGHLECCQILRQHLTGDMVFMARPEAEKAAPVDLDAHGGGATLFDEDGDQTESCDAHDLAIENGHWPVANWLEATKFWTTPLHFFNTLSPDKVRCLLRSGADLHASAPESKITPLFLAMEMDAKGSAPAGSSAWLILQAANPWSLETHNLFPEATRSRAKELGRMGSLIARSELLRKSGQETAILDVWFDGVLRHAIPNR